MKRVMIGLITLGGVALWWTDASAQCAGGVGIGGSCITRGLLGRSLVGITRSLDPGDSTFEFFGTVGQGCNHNFKEGKLDCNCRIRGTAYCVPAGEVPLGEGFSASGANRHTSRWGWGHDDDDNGEEDGDGEEVGEEEGDGDDDGEEDGDDDGSQLKTKRQILPAVQVNNFGNPAFTTPSPGGDPQTGASFLAAAELEPPSECVDCPAGTTFLTFIADEVVVRSTFCPDNYLEPCHTAIQVCRGGRGLNPTEIGSYDCQTVFQCTSAQGEGGGSCSSTTGMCDETCEGGEGPG